MDRTLDERILFTFNKKGTLLKESVSGMGKGMLGMHALKTTTKSKIKIMVFKEDNLIERIYIGNEEFPQVKHMDRLAQGDELYLDDFIIDETHLNMSELLDIIKKLEYMGYEL